MSFEGFYRILCENGHLSSSDAYDYGDYYRNDGEECWKCSVCGAKESWRQLIDQTNDSGVGQEWPLTVLEEAVYETCSHDHKHCTKKAVYKIPKYKDYTFSLTEDEIENVLIEWYETKHAINRRVVSLELEDTGSARDGIVACFKTMPKVTEGKDD